MVHAIGLDIVEVERIRKDITQYGDKFVNRILSSEELESYDKRLDKELFLAGRFAAKEAIIKALGKFLTDRPPYTDLQVLNDNTGQPFFMLTDYIMKKIGKAVVLLSISHEKNYAAAMVVISED
ncbi:MAG: holo-ACP synthase [bacterium]